MRSKEITAMIKEGLFKSGVVLDRATVQKLTKRARPTASFKRKTIKNQLASNLLLVEFQTNVNKQLHDKGLHLRGEDYATSFRVLSRKQTATTVDFYYSKADGATSNFVQLVAGRAKRK
jgi:hypothetical protein